MALPATVNAMQEGCNPPAGLSHTLILCCRNYNHYPAVTGKSFPEGSLRVLAHTDYEVLTLLFQQAGESLHRRPNSLKTSQSHRYTALHTRHNTAHRYCRMMP